MSAQRFIARTFSQNLDVSRQTPSENNSQLHKLKTEKAPVNYLSIILLREFVLYVIQILVELQHVSSTTQTAQKQFNIYNDRDQHRQKL